MKRFIEMIEMKIISRVIYFLVDCEFGDWKNWTTCDRPCDGGEQYRTREVKTFAKHGGELCQGDAKEVQVCNPQPCPSKYYRNSNHFNSWSLKHKTLDNRLSFI